MRLTDKIKAIETATESGQSDQGSGDHQHLTHHGSAGCLEPAAPASRFSSHSLFSLNQLNSASKPNEPAHRVSSNFGAEISPKDGFKSTDDYHNAVKHNPVLQAIGESGSKPRTSHLSSASLQHRRDLASTAFSPCISARSASVPRPKSAFDKENIVVKQNLNKSQHSSEEKVGKYPPLEPPTPHENKLEQQTSPKENPCQENISQHQSSSHASLKIGKNNYRVLRQIGSGGFSSVFSVASETDGRLYGLKQVRLSSENQLNDALREADMLRSLADTGCVVRVHEVAAVRKKVSCQLFANPL